MNFLRLPLSPKDHSILKEKATQWKNNGLEVNSDIPTDLRKISDGISFRIRIKQGSVDIWFTGTKYAGKKRIFRLIPFYVIAVTLWTPNPFEEGEEDPSLAGYAASCDHTKAWQQIFDWIQGVGSLYPNELNALLGEL